MRKLAPLFFILFLLTCFLNKAGAMTPEQYIAKFKGCAIEQMLIYNIPASITLAQGMLESKCGNSPLARFANNHFGIKCHDDWTGEYYLYNDDKMGEHFRKYQNADDSYRDHAEFLKSRPWYIFLFKFSRTDYKDWAKGLEKAGYATDKDYAFQLMEIIKKNRLFIYDTVLQNLTGYSILYNIKPVIPATKCNGQRYVVVRHGDCIYKIAREFNIDALSLCRFNDISLTDILMPGRKIYLTDRNNSQDESSAINNRTGDIINSPHSNSDYREKKFD